MSDPKDAVHYELTHGCGHTTKGAGYPQRGETTFTPPPSAQCWACYSTTPERKQFILDENAKAAAFFDDPKNVTHALAIGARIDKQHQARLESDLIGREILRHTLRRQS